MRVVLACLVIAGCRSPSSHPSSPSDSGGDGAGIVVDAAGDASPAAGSGTESHALGINDVTMLIELPDDALFGTTLARLSGVENSGDLVGRDVFAQFVTAPGDVAFGFDDFHVVGVRFDLCDRRSAAPCQDGDDGQLRLVFQPVTSGSVAPVEGADVGLHATYPIPAPDLAFVVNELRALARLRAFQTASPIAIDDEIHSTSPPSEYRKRLAALITHYASAATLQRLSLLALPPDVTTNNIHWSARSLVRVGGQLVPFPIPSVGATTQDIQLVQTLWPPGFATTPASADDPPGMQLALDASAFTAAPYLTQSVGMQALATAQNPQLTSFAAEQCVNCHASTFLTFQRAKTQGVDPTQVMNTFTSSTHDISIKFGVDMTEFSTIRAFGWIEKYPLFSQRVANDSAVVLDEIAVRFPPAQTTTLPDAGLPDAPPSVNRVFVTRALFPAGFGGLAGGDATCSSVAMHANLGGTWTAWLSSSTVNAIDRVGAGPWYRIDGTTLVFANKAAIASGPASSIDRDETNAEPPDPYNVWTGTTTSGVASATCADWTSTSPMTAGTMGLRPYTDATWTDYGGAPCNLTAHVYCFEN